MSRDGSGSDTPPRRKAEAAASALPPLRFAFFFAFFCASVISFFSFAAALPIGSASVHGIVHADQRARPAGVVNELDDVLDEPVRWR